MMNYLLWQLADSGFPAGGFAHSGGLEAAMQHGLVRDRASVRDVCRARGAAGRAAARCRWPAPRIATPNGLPNSTTCPTRFSAARWRIAPAARKAGRCSAARYDRSRTPQLSPIDDRVRVEELAAHHAPLFGAIMRALEIELGDAQRLLLYLTARGVGGAAVRLGLIGAYDAQELQTWLAPHSSAWSSASGISIRSRSP